jgi:hypothetical protein
MRTSESIANIAPALAKAQAMCLSVTKTKVGKIETKGGRSYEYNYNDFASVVQEIKPALTENNIAMIQWAERADDGITVITRLQHASGEWEETDMPVPVMIVSAQTLGSALTYGKRYGAQAAMLLPSADDDGKAASDKPVPRPNTAKQVSVDAFEELDAAEQKYLQDLATELIDMAHSGDDAYGYAKSKRLSTEHELAIWCLLPSDVRSLIKKQAPRPAALASQP